MNNKPDNTEVTIITTHVNADYDAIASMLAAQKLYRGQGFKARDRYLLMSLKLQQTDGEKPK